MFNRWGSRIKLLSLAARRCPGQRTGGSRHSQSCMSPCHVYDIHSFHLHEVRRSRSAPTFSIAAIVSLTLVLAACWDDPLEPGSDPVASMSQISRGGLFPEARGIEDDFLRIEADVPGFGGLYLDHDQNVVAYVTDLSRAGVAAARIRQEFLQDPTRPGQLRRPDGSEPTIRIVKGAYSMSELIHWQQSMWAGAASQHRIWLADADEGRNRVRLGIESLENIAQIHALAESKSVPVEALYLEEMSLPVSTANLTDAVRPTKGGLKVSHTSTGSMNCSMGFNARDSNNDRYFLTSSHCTDQFTGNMLNLSFYQPGENVQNPPPRVGGTAHNPAWSTSGCATGVDYCRSTDVASVEYDSGVTHGFSVIETTTIGTGSNPGSQTIGPIRNVIGVATPAQGMVLYKTGQTTGTTTTAPGGITGTCWPLKYLHLATNDTLGVSCAYGALMHGDGGDSGAPVYRMSGSNVEAVGINFAAGGGGVFFNGWSQIESELGVSLNPIAPLSVAIGGPTEIRDDDPCGWNAAVGGGRPPYSFSWTGVFTSNQPSVLGTVEESGELRLVVESDDDQIKGDTIFINVTPTAPDCVFRAPKRDGQ